MRTTKLFTIPVIIGIVFLYACNRQIVSLDYTTAKDEVPQLGNLVFRFSKPLVNDSLLNQWDSTQYISFQPKIDGRFRWEHGDELVFSPSRPLLAATTYKAKLSNELLRFSKFDKVEKGENLVFSTADLKLENTNTTWVVQDEANKTALPQVDLYFNYPVEAAALNNKLLVTVDGLKADYSLQSVSASDKVSLRIAGLKTEDRDYNVEISLDKGIVPEGGTNATKEKTTTKALIPSPFTLTINDVNADHDGSTGTITVRTSQQVQAENLASFIKFIPVVKFTVQSTDDGFVISSDAFDATKSYALTLVKGLRGRIGGTLKEDYKNNFAFGKMQPAVSFVNRSAVYLAGQGAKNIEVKLVSVEKVKVIISKIYENNLLAAQASGYYPKENGGNEDGEYYEGGSDAVVGDIIYEKEIDTKTLPKSGAARLFNFNFEDKLAGFKGIYHIKIKSTADNWVSDSRFISLSDFGLIAKEGNDKIFVFVNSLKTALPVSGVNVIAYGANNQLLGTGSSNADGVAEINYAKNEFAGFRPAMIIAKTETDFSYLPFNTTKVNMSRFDVGGKHSNSTGLDAFIYAERDIYRPGEKINFSLVLRDRLWRSPGELPVKLKFLLPNGKELKAFRKNLNEQGSLEGNIDLTAAAVTGSYSLEVYNGNDILLGTQSFRVEEFVPDRIKVTAKLDKESMVTGESVKLGINAMNFFGPPAANRNYECEIQVKQKYFRPKNHDRYNFSIANAGISFDKTVKEGQTDADGNASESFTAKQEYKNAGLLQASFYTTVFDETGRPVSRLASANIYTQPVFFGIGEDGWWYYPLNQPIKTPLLALNKDEQIISASAKVEVIKHEYRTVLTKSGQYFRYESQKEDKIVSSSLVNITGESSSYSFTPRTAGDYELRISIPGANTYVAKSFYSYGSWGNDNSSFEVSTEGNIDISPDKTAYQSGETAKLLFKTPFSGKMLVTMETDKVVSYQFVNVDGRQASVDIKLTADHLPNVYITATLIKPHDVSDIPLTVAHGYKNIMVEEKSRKMDVEVMAQSSVRSHTHQKIKVKAAAGSYVTLAAVDNGVLQVSNFETPDPYGYFYSQRALGVTGYDMYPLLFPEVRRLSSTGGDGDLETNKRSNPMPNKRIKIVSYWSGIAKANASGEADFEFDIPQFSGEIRLMAVAYKNESFGSRESTIKVADPIVLSTALPRFLSPGDTVNVPITITNTTSKNTSAEAVFAVTAPLQVVGATQQSVDLKANSEAKMIFKLVASPAISTGKIKVEVRGMGEKFVDETDITVRPASTLQKITGSGSVAGNSSQKITIGLSDFMPGSGDYKLVVSRSPALQLANQFAYLVEYPYGCTEQTVSTAFPQLYYGDLADLFNTGKTSKASANGNIQEAIRKIKLRQLYNGGITLWDGEGTEHWWASVYAAHFLIEAQKAGFDVDNGLLQTLLNFVNGKLRNRETIIYYYNLKEQKKIAPKEVAYSLYVLALAGKPNISVMNYYKANPALLALDSRYLLSASYALAGDKTRFAELLPASFSGEESVAQTGGSFYSDIRDESIALNTLIDVDPANRQIPVMAKHVADKLKQRSWYNTQESAFSFLAMGKLARAANKSTVTASINSNGKTAGTFTGNSLQLDNKQLAGNNIDIVTKGNGSLYYWWQSRGISASGAYKEEDNYIKVRRKFYDRYGRVITGNTFKQNDLVLVQLTLEKSYSGSVENIVLTDLLPAGFEIENPRTKELPGMEWIKDAAAPTAMDVRDDRINLFVDLNSARQVYYYAVRAVSPGIYKMGPVSADAMYNGEYHSYNGAGTIKITQ